MSKLPSVTTIAVIATLLAGCSSTPASEPDARTTSSPAATSATASPSAEPTVEETEEGESEVTAEASPAPSPEPPAEPIAETPEERAPNLEPLPVQPGDPFVPPPHGEPNPGIPVTPGVPGVPHVDPAYFDWVKVTPAAGDPNAGPTATVQQGETLAVVGDGYAPGQRVYVMLAWPHTDTNYIVEPSTAVADQNGYFIYPIHIGANVPPRDYGVMTVPMDADGRFIEELKRFHNVIITAAP